MTVTWLKIFYTKNNKTSERTLRMNKAQSHIIVVVTFTAVSRRSLGDCHKLWLPPIQLLVRVSTRYRMKLSNTYCCKSACWEETYLISDSAQDVLITFHKAAPFGRRNFVKGWSILLLQYSENSVWDHLSSAGNSLIRRPVLYSPDMFSHWLPCSTNLS